MKKTSASVAVLAAVAVVLALAGCAGAAPAEPPTTSASPTPAPTATQAAAPTVRVATTCDALASQAQLDQAGGTHLPASTAAVTPNPPGYGNQRMGVLTCVWATSDPNTGAGPAVQISVVPDATRAGFEAYRTGEAVASSDTPSSVGPDAYTYCAGEPVVLCGFHALLPHYGIVGTVFGGGSSLGDGARSAIDAMLAQTYGVVSGLAAPATVWQPPAPALQGASDCDAIVTSEQLTAATGVGPAHAAKSDDGEYSTSLFNVAHQVGAFWCGWVEDDGGTSFTIGVLPGGATYLEHLRGSDAEEQPGVGDAAFWAPDGDLNVVADSGWLQVRAVPGEGKTAPTHDQLAALAKQIIANLGTT
jgi:hypothetical protein